MNKLTAINKIFPQKAFLKVLSTLELCIKCQHTPWGGGNVRKGRENYEIEYFQNGHQLYKFSQNHLLV